MKPSRNVVLAVLALVGLGAFGALAQSTVTRILNLQVLNQMLVGTSTATGNKVTKMLGGSASINFPNASTTCSSVITDGGPATITVTGAAVGDPCFVGAPAAAAANSSFTCYVSATNTVTVRACAAGTASDPDEATYSVRVISAQ